MNETEMRRKRLLEETRRRYGETRVPPAVHPRYSSVYSNLYRSGAEEVRDSGTFGVRLVLAIVLFAAFIALDDQKIKVANVDSKSIIAEIERNFDY